MVWSNVTLQLTTYTVASERLPAAFDGYRIAHVSDLHNAEMGDNNADLLAMLKEASPDIIAITGDIIDCNRTDTAVAIDFVREAVKIAPCYYVTGNHEAWIGAEDYNTMEQTFTALGVTVLHDQAVPLSLNGETITLAGIDDPTFIRKQKGGNGLPITPQDLSTLYPSDGFRILLSHRPEHFDTYVDADIDLVLSGHVHGGQFRLPFLGGLYGPDQGILPAYDSGLYTEGSTNMVVSRGIGNSGFPIRFNNRPNVVLVELTCSP
jgi:predicted MPP superfamily phosphohydrolase